MARNPARAACVTFGALSNWASVGPKGRMSGQPICSGMPSCATSSHVTDLFAMGPFGLRVIVHLNTRKPLELDHAEARRTSTDGVGDIAGRQMPIVLFHHARVGMTQVLRHDEQRHAVHDGVACPGVPERVETDWRVDLSVLTCLRHRAKLVRGTPQLAVGFAQHDFAAGAPGSELP